MWRTSAGASGSTTHLGRAAKPLTAQGRLRGGREAQPKSPMCCGVHRITQVAAELASLSRRDASRDASQSTPSRTPLAVRLSYVDDDGDRVGVASDGALREAVAAARDAGKDRLHLDAHGEACEGGIPAAATAAAANAAAAAAASAASAASAAAAAAAARLGSLLPHALERDNLMSVSAVALAAGAVLAVAVARRWR